MSVCGCGCGTVLGARRRGRSPLWVNGGHAERARSRAVDPVANFWSKVARTTPDACWPWAAGRIPNGYGAFAQGGRNHGAHRIAYMLTNGPIPEGLCVLHRCDNRPCCNPAHLFLGTLGDNNTDRARKHRGVYGDEHPSATITFVQGREILRRYQDALCGSGVTMKTLAAEYGVSTGTMTNIIAMRGRWTALSEEVGQ